jgi:hypothetical protein
MHKTFNILSSFFQFPTLSLFYEIFSAIHQVSLYYDKIILN